MCNCLYFQFCRNLSSVSPVLPRKTCCRTFYYLSLKRKFVWKIFATLIFKNFLIKNYCCKKWYPTNYCRIDQRFKIFALIKAFRVYIFMIRSYRKLQNISISSFSSNKNVCQRNTFVWSYISSLFSMKVIQILYDLG